MNVLYTLYVPYPCTATILCCVGLIRVIKYEYIIPYGKTKETQNLDWWLLRSLVWTYILRKICMSVCSHIASRMQDKITFIHSFCSLSNDRSIASSKVSSLQGAI
jgi:hypothetical protein